MRDNDRFKIIQDNWLKDKKKADWDEMFLLVLECCRVFTYKWCKRYNIIIGKEDREDYARDSCVKIMKRYLKPKGYYIKNLPSVCRLRVMGDLLSAKNKFERSHLHYSDNIDLV